MYKQKMNKDLKDYLYMLVGSILTPDEDDIPCVKILFKNKEWVNIGGVTLQQIRELMEKVK